MAEAPQFDGEIRQICPNAHQLVIGGVQAEIQAVLDLLVDRERHGEGLIQRLARLFELIWAFQRHAAQVIDGIQRQVRVRVFAHIARRARVVVPGLIALHHRAGGKLKIQRAVHARALGRLVHRRDGNDLLQLDVLILGCGGAQRLTEHVLQRRTVRRVEIETHGGYHAVRIRQIVGVGLMLEIAVIAAAVPHVRGQRHHAAVAGGIEAVGIAAVPGADDAARGAHGARDVCIRRVHALEHLIAGGIHHVVIARGRCGLLFQRVGARRHGLRLQRLQRPGIAHFIGDHAAEIILHIRGQHGAHAARLVHGKAQVARVQRFAAGFGNDQTVLALTGLPREREGRTHVQRQAAAGEIQLAVCRRDQNLAALRKAEARVALHGVQPVKAQAQARVPGQRFQIYADHAVILFAGELNVGRFVRLGRGLRRVGAGCACADAERRVDGHRQRAGQGQRCDERERRQPPKFLMLHAFFPLLSSGQAGYWIDYRHASDALNLSKVKIFHTGTRACMCSCVSFRAAPPPALPSAAPARPA